MPRSLDVPSRGGAARVQRPQAIVLRAYVDLMRRPEVTCVRPVMAVSFSAVDLPPPARHDARTHGRRRPSPWLLKGSVVSLFAAADHRAIARRRAGQQPQPRRRACCSCWRAACPIRSAWPSSPPIRGCVTATSSGTTSCWAARPATISRSCFTRRELRAGGHILSWPTTPVISR